MRPYIISHEISLDQAISSLPIALQSRNHRDQLIRQEEELAKQLGDRYKGVDTDWAAIEADVSAISDYLTTHRTAVSQEFFEIICDSEELRTEARTALDTLKDAQSEALKPYQAFAKYFDESEKIGTVALSTLSDRYKKCLNGW